MKKAFTRHAAALFLLLLMLSPACGNQDEVREINTWNSYVELNNSLLLSFFQPLELYFTAFGRTEEYRPAVEQADLIHFVSGLPEAENVQKNISQSLAAMGQAESELDEAVADMLPHLQELLQALGESRDYHAAQRYGQDEYAEAARIHARLYAAHSAFLPAYQNFSRLLHAEDAERRSRDIEKMLAQNLRLKPAMLQAVDAAQNMQDYFSARQITAETISNLEADVFMKLFTAYSSAARNFLALPIEQGNLGKEALREPGLKDFTIRLQDVSATAAPIMAYCQKEENQEPIKVDDIEKFSKNIGKLVDSYNSTIKQ